MVQVVRLAKEKHLDGDKENGQGPFVGTLSLQAVAERYTAREVLLAEWVKGSHQKFYRLVKTAVDPRSAWEEVDPGEIFR
jgi:hypothetical protein